MRLYLFKLLLWIGVSSGALVSTALAQNSISSEAIVIHNIGGGLEWFAKTHSGVLPSSWQELNAVYPLDRFATYDVSSIPDNYILVNKPALSSQMDIGGSGQIIMIGREPKAEVGRATLGRYVIYRMASGDYRDAWFAEEQIKKIIAETGIVIPAASAADSNSSVSRTVVVPGGTRSIQADISRSISPNTSEVAPASKVRSHGEGISFVFS